MSGSLRRFTAAFAGTLLLSFVPPLLSAADFIRGDSNGDQKVSISDSTFLLGYLFLGSPGPECENAGDADDSGMLDLSDAIKVLNGLFLGGTVPAPFPSAGPDPTAPSLDCASYGNGQPLEDPEARLEIASATAPGGADRKATIILALTNSKAIGSYYLKINDPAGVLEDRGMSYRSGLKHLANLVGRDDEGREVQNPRRPDFASGKVKDGQVDAGVLMSLTSPVEIPPGENVPLVELFLCLKPGTAAGDYPLTLEAAELAASCVGVWGSGACPDTGRPIYPALVSGTLHVEADVAASGSDCDTLIPEPPPPIHILFKLEDATGSPGAPVAVPLVLKADRPSQGFSYSIDFDETMLEAEGTNKLWTKPNGTPYEFEKFEFDNQDRISGNSGIVEGFLAGAAVFSLTDSGEVLPPNQEVEVLQFDLRVKAGAPAGSTELAFKDGALGSGGQVPNKLIAGGSDITPSLASSFVFVNARINIVADVTLFIRGDSNGDRAVDISDPVTTLGYLYLGDPTPRCSDGADANDDGKLDIADPVASLEILFKGGGPFPEPFGRPGVDPTPDSLNCSASPL